MVTHPTPDDDCRPIVIVTGRHRPHQIAFLALSVLFGLAFTFGAPPPQSVAALMPQWLVALWAVGLLLSGVLGLVGIAAIRRVQTGLLLEVASMLLGAGALTIVTFAVFAYSGWKGFFGGGLCVAWAVANLVRAGQIRRDLETLQRGLA